MKKCWITQAIKIKLGECTGSSEVWWNKCSQSTFPGQIKSTPSPKQEVSVESAFIVSLLTNTIMDTIIPE